MRRLLPLFAWLLLTGHGPFQCQSPEVDRATTALAAGEHQSALDALAEVADDAPEVHLARGVVHLLRDELDEANSALDQAYRLVAGAEARGEPLPNGKALRGRIAFARGLVAAQRDAWVDAQVEFRKALEVDPTDDDARWNLEMAWYKANPPCPAREDDHEPDDTRADGKPWAEAHAKDRLLCPGNSDWFALPDVPVNGMLYVRLKAEIDTSDDETRDLTLSLFGPGDADDAPTRSVPAKGGKAATGIGGVRRGGVWHVRVEGPGRAEATYGLEVEVVPPCPVDDSLEENDSREVAKPVKEGEQKSLKACPGDADWYRIDVPRTKGMRVSIAYDASRAPLRATLYDQFGTQLVEGREGPNGIGLRIPQLDEPPPTDDATQGGQGKPADATPPPEGPPQAWYVEVITATDEENNYALQVQPDDNDGGKDKDDNQQDQKDDQQDKQDDQKDQQDKQDQKDKQDDKQPGEDADGKDPKQAQQPQPKPDEQQPPPEQVDIDKLIDALDQHPNNPQLEKALRGLQVIPRMEDY